MCTPNLKQENTQLKKRNRRLEGALDHAASRLRFLTNWLEYNYFGKPKDVGLGRRYEKVARTALEEK